MDINLYEELELDVKITDKDKILKAIDEKIAWYNKRVNIPRFAIIGEKKKRLLNDLKAQIQNNPAIIQQHAVAYVEIAKKKEADVKRKLQEIGSLYVSNGMIAEINLKHLVSELKMSESEILRILNAKVKKEKVIDVPEDNVEELDPSKMKTIMEHLQVVGKKSVYEFLGLSPKAPLSEIQKAFQKLEDEVKNAGTVISTSEEYRTKYNIVKVCRPIFATEQGRKGYDKAIENAGFADVREAIMQMKAGIKIINAQQYKQMLNICTKNGIPRNKAEYLIYTTAKKAGLEIDEGNVQTQIICRYCGALNEQTAKACATCGMPIQVVCPKCGKPSGNEDYSCVNCGFSLFNMREAPIKIKMAQVALDMGDIDSAIREYEAAAAYWPGHPGLQAVQNGIKKVQKQVETAIDEAKELCKQRAYYGARALFGKIGYGAEAMLIRKEVDGAVNNADNLIAKAKTARDANEQIDFYMQALSICADCVAAKEKLQLTPPTPPARIQAQVKGRTIHVEWAKLPSQYIQYKLVRKANGRPAGPADGTVISETLSNFVDDIKAEPGISYYYAVYSKCGDVYSPRAAITTGPVITVADIDLSTITLDIQETQIKFSIQFPKNAKSVEVYRDEKLIKNLTGSSYIDTNLKTGQSYTYKFITVYEDSNQQKHKTAGVTQVIRPMSPPRPVKLELTENDHTAKLSWEKPAKGTLCIYESETPFTILENNKVNIDNLKYRQIDITGTTYHIAKNFSGVRYYLPVTVEGNIGIAGAQVRLISIITPAGVKFDRNEKQITVTWKWENIASVRIQVQADGGNTQKYDIDTPVPPTYKVAIPKDAKNIRITIASRIKVQGETLLSKEIEYEASLKTVKVNFQSVESNSIFGIIRRDSYSLTIVCDSVPPCDLQLLISENFVPTNLVNYKTYLDIAKREIKPGVPIKKDFKYERKQKNKPLYFRIIAKDRAQAHQVVIIPETRQLK